MPPPAPARFTWLTREWVALAGLLLFTLAVRGGVMWAMRANLQDDPDAYREIAENVLTHGVYGMGKSAEPPAPTAYRPPLYPILLSNLPAADGKHISLVKVAIVHLLLGVATVWLTYLTARRLVAPSGPEGAGAESTSRATPFPHGVRELHVRELLAGLLVACDPILLNQQTLVMTETLATFLAVLALWCLAHFHAPRYWWNAGLAGVAIGLAVLCRPTFLPWLGLVAAAMVIADCGLRIAEWPKRAWRAVANLAAFVLVAAAVVSPWVIRNQREMGKPILGTTHGGYTLFLGNNISFYDWLKSANRSGLPWKPPTNNRPPGTRPKSTASTPNPPFWKTRETEVWDDELHYSLAHAAIRQAPGMFARSCIFRIGQLWSPLPNKLTADESAKRTALRYLTAAWYCGVYLLAAVGVWRLRWRLFAPPLVWGLLLCVTFTAVHTFYWSNLRMRAPLMPFVALVAAAAFPPKALTSGQGDRRAGGPSSTDPA
jgi:4-amino-4-deoxy-L-arabinose transferase-like glycosyltransferase